MDVFIARFGRAFADLRTVGVTAGDDFVHGCSDEVVLRRIAEKYLGDSTLTIVLLGDTTWSRRFVDWEIAASAAHGSRVLAVDLPGNADLRRLPPRLASCGALLRPRYPSSVDEVASWSGHEGTEMVPSECPDLIAALCRSDVREAYS